MSQDKEKSVAVIIPTFNREKVLVDTIESVLSLSPPADEVWVIDQTQTHDPETATYLKKVSGRGVNVITLPEPGVCFARNLGAALSNADIVIYLDDDVIIEKKDFIELHRQNYMDPDVDAVWGQIVNPCREVRDTLKPGGVVPSNYAKRVGRTKQLVSANHSIRREVMLKMGGYDESFSGRTYANEDGDLGRRLYGENYRIVFDPEPTLVHFHAQSGGNRITGRDAFPEWTRSVTFFQFMLRHYSRFNRIWQGIRILRTITFRKENVLRFWLLPHSVIHAVYGYFVACRRHRQGFSSSLISVGADHLRKQYLPERSVD